MASIIPDKTNNRGEVAYETAVRFPSVKDASTAAVTLTAIDVSPNGIIIGAPSAARDYTLPTAALMSAQVTHLPINAGWRFSIQNSDGTNAITLVTGGSGWTLPSAALCTVALATGATFLVRKTGHAAFTVYRV